MSLTEEELGMLFDAAYKKALATCCYKKQISRPTTLSKLSKLKMSNGNLRPSLPNNAGSFVPARCGYRTGKCTNAQAFKRSRIVHKLCEFHRERANMNQKKLDRKKRLKRTKMTSEAHSSC
ncbi:hypothetical protein Plhal304r1_c005g0019601 [Plasmopara halstedii]